MASAEQKSKSPTDAEEEAWQPRKLVGVFFVTIVVVLLILYKISPYSGVVTP